MKNKYSIGLLFVQGDIIISADFVDQLNSTEILIDGKIKIDFNAKILYIREWQD